ncbi:MAG TPA: hypothetical protein VNL37_01775, partial [Candidatus Polarisedimenticolia bacterium]|nr:hypothetical protein [Candidatus Polarisedimenticolia bacterium]
MPKRIEDYLRRIGALNLLFAASSVGLLLALGWMVLDDYSRGWKSYQVRFQRLEADKTRGEIDKAREAEDREALERQRHALAEARAAADQHARDRRAIQDRLRQVEKDAYKDDLAYRFTKSTFDAKKFDYEEARHHALPSAPALQRQMNDLEAQLETLRVRNQEHDKARAEAEAALKAITEKVDAAQKTLSDATATVDRLEKKLDTVAPRGFMRAAIDLLNAPLLDFIAPTLKIRQVVLDDIPIDINFTRIPRADRCQTCHLGADRIGFEDAPQPFTTHPHMDLFVGGTSPHPVERFGCTPCHAGRDRAVDFVFSDHTPDTEEQRRAWRRDHDWKPDRFWEYPMLARSRTEAGCLKCHQGVVEVPQAPHLDRGLELIDRYGCYGCHKLRGFEDRPRVGPILTRITAKTTPEWMARWIKNPKAFRPSTRMPRLFGLSNQQAEEDHRREDAEILGIVAYLTSKSERLAYPPLPGRGDARRGARLVRSIGCLGCHAIESMEVEPAVLQARNRHEAADPIVWERRFGPDLSRVGSKLRPEWVFQWVQNPHAYNPTTRMPNLRLSRGEALDVTAYLMTLRDDSPAAERVEAPGPQPEARDAALMAYLTQRMPPEDARAHLAGMSDRERD